MPGRVLRNLVLAIGVHPRHFLTGGGHFILAGSENRHFLRAGSCAKERAAQVRKNGPAVGAAHNRMSCPCG